jgi:DNA-binding LacI/PurR family transcriptional regulator
VSHGTGVHVGDRARREIVVAASIEDVAVRAGVSTATVSRALRGLPNVSPETRRRVLAAAHALDYVASPSASSLASGRMSTVGVITPYLGRWFFGTVIGGAEAELRVAGHDLLLYTIGGEGHRYRFFDQLPLRRRVDAVLVLTLPMEGDEVEAVRSLGMPVSIVGARVEGFSSVRIDDVAGAELGVRHLVALGHRRIGLISGGRTESNRFTAPTDRSAGYRRVLVEAGLSVDPALDVDGEFTVAGGERAMAELLGRPEPPTAVFAQSDEMAFGALRAVRRAGLSCPGDVSLCGFDDHEMADLFDLTTVAQPVQEQGVLAARQVLAALSGGEYPQASVLPTSLVVRGTTAPPGSP